MEKKVQKVVKYIMNEYLLIYHILFIKTGKNNRMLMRIINKGTSRKQYK